MRYLLDTNVFIWWITNSDRLSDTQREIITNPKNEILFSAISAWEISIKAALGKLQEVGDPETSVPFHVRRNNFVSLSFSSEAALRVYKLAGMHQDPFDRALIAQALVLDVPVLTRDQIYTKYGVEVI